jgi:hypothetical protein
VPWQDRDVTRPGPVAASVIAWTLGAAVSIGVGLLALSLVGVGLSGDSDEHLTAPVGRVDAPGTAVTATPTTDPPAVLSTSSGLSPLPTGPNRTIETAGGTVVAHCVGDNAYLVYWSPSPGFRSDDPNRGPAPEARITFEGSGREIKIRVTCTGLTVHPSIQDEQSGHG